MRRLLEEIRDIVRFFRLPRSQREVVFYAENASYYTFLGGLLEELARRGEVSLCYVTSQATDPILQEAPAGVRTFYVSGLLAFMFPLIDAKLIVMTMPDLHRFGIRRSQRGARHVYLFHNIGSYFHVVREGGLLHYDTIFCVGPHHRRELAREEEIFGIAEREHVDFGYGRLDQILAEHRRRVGASPERETRRVFVAPGWGPWHDRNSMLDLCGRQLVRSVLDAGFEVVFRPHPMTRIKYAESLDSLYAEFRDDERFMVNEDVADLTPFYESDVMVSDWSGVVYEFAFGVERPVAFIDSPMKVNNERYAEWGFEPVDVAMREELGIVVSLEEVEKIGSRLEELVSNVDAWRERIAGARERLIYNVGRSSEAGADYIVGACRR